MPPWYALGMTRRELLVAALAAASGRAARIDRIERRVIWNGRRTGTTWFMPRVTAIPGTPRPLLVMTCQTINGSDYYGPLHWSESRDLGATWSDPAPIPGLGRRTHPDGVEEGVCDVVPEYHAKTGVVLALGHNVYYKDGKLTRPSEQRWPVYFIRRADGSWTAPRKLEWDEPEASAMHTSGCAQRVTLPGGDILLPLSFGPQGRQDRAVASVLCSFDGTELKIRRKGNTLRLAVARGLLEPSMERFGGRYYMTIRAEDGRGYVSTSADGLEWAAQRPWCWQDGEPLGMSTTQQHFLPLGGALFLVYTRRDPSNERVMRWRAPIYIAQVDAAKAALIRDTERIVFPLIGDGVKAPEGVARMGNFHTLAITERLALITVAEEHPNNQWRGDTLLSRLTAR
jgi:hypothetical protein